MSDLLYGGLVVLSEFLFPMQPVLLKSYKYKSLIMSLLQGIINCATYFSIILYYLNYNNISFSFIDFYTNKLQLIIQLLGFYAFIIFAYTFPLLPASISVPMFALWPVFLDLLSKEFYGINITTGQYVSFIVVLVGVLVMSYSPVKTKNQFSFITILLLISGIFTISFVYSLLSAIEYSEEIKNHKLLKSSLNISLTSTGLLTGVLVLIGVSRFFNNKDLPSLLKITKYPGIKDALFILIGYFFTSSIMNLMNITGYDNLPTTTYAVLDNTSIIASMIIGYIFLKEKISYQKIAGAIVVILGIGINIHYRNTKNDKMVLKPFYKKWLT